MNLVSTDPATSLVQWRSIAARPVEPLTSVAAPRTGDGCSAYLPLTHSRRRKEPPMKIKTLVGLLGVATVALGACGSAAYGGQTYGGNATPTTARCPDDRGHVVLGRRPDAVRPRSWSMARAGRSTPSRRTPTGPRPVRAPAPRHGRRPWSAPPCWRARASPPRPRPSTLRVAARC